MGKEMKAETDRANGFDRISKELKAAKDQLEGMGVGIR